MEKPKDEEPTCRVVLLGPESESSPEQLIRGLRQRFRLSAHQAEALVRKAPVVVKKGLTLEKANYFAHRLEEIGARVQIEQVHPAQPPPIPSGLDAGLEGIVPPRPEGISSEPYCLWEDMENLGFFRAFFGTIGDVLFHPSRFFSQMPVGRGLIRPLIFALVASVVGGMFGLLYQFLMMRYVGGFFEAQALSRFGVPMIVISAIWLPVGAIVGVFIGTAVVHLCLMIVRGNQKGFEASFRVVAYGMSTKLFGIIPFLGGAIGAIWLLVVGIVGMREAHGISTGRAALAVFLPVLVVLALLAVLVIAMIPIILKILSEVIANL